MGFSDDGGRGVWVMRHWAAGERQVLRRVWCPDCGPGDTAEYKQVTVLFADVVRSMDIAAAVGAERLREIMAELVGRGAAVVQRYGGTMEKFTGDGLMALFGAPVVLEDHAIRACLAALDIQSETGHLAAEVQRRDNISLRLRVGLNSGRVVAGEMGSGVTGYAAIGETVGYAQRMESVAPHGGVMLSEATALLVEHAAVVKDTELVRIKGADQPVPVRQLVAIGPRDAVVGRADASLVGRNWEMAVLDAMVDRAIGRPRWCRECGRTARDRKEPGGTGGCGVGRRSRVRRVLDLLRIPCQRHSLPSGCAAAAREHGCD